MLSVSKLSAGYGKKAVLTDIDILAMQPGTITAFLGQNGAGKSTLLRSLAGLHRASGTLSFSGEDISHHSPAQRARAITYMPQSLPQRVALTVLEATIGALRASSRDPDAVKRSLAVLERLGIEKLAMAQLDSLSGGQRQLASLAQALVRKPRVLLLDEPTSALDVAHQIRVMRTIREITEEQQIIAIAVLHDLGLACRWCDRLVMLAGGRVVSDGEPQVALTPSVLNQVYGVTGRIERCSRGRIQVLIDEVA
ncbi:ABC transporter ATP-binding protein [Neorhizobium alkalisoli]|uniref:Iron complex transport system ATP-binding protein n=1 Tax=Neorhizobium alkalisoli TaxID=528178 RepID=A0A561QNT5_9HYPH|nr:ABC transporter ATP-binding protein [Neorhizobium alkalisoli]TWF52061.1 iron complex transport system ATP-binding protein [Neorhizobium alkalisoli]